MLGGFQHRRRRCCADEPKLAEAFRTGEGVGWHEHDHRLFEGTERFFRPGYTRQPGRRLAPGARRRRGQARGRRRGRRRRLRPRRLDDHHGRGLPGARRFVGFDYHDASIERRASARARPGVARPGPLRGRRRPRTSRAPATTWSRSSTACTTWATRSARLAHVRETLAPDGTWMIVEPFADDRVEDNLNPVGRRLLLRPRRMLCTPALARAGGRAGARRAGRRGAARARSRARPASRRFRRATETPFNLVLEARP